jgi:hypothetical protein
MANGEFPQKAASFITSGASSLFSKARPTSSAMLESNQRSLAPKTSALPLCKSPMVRGAEVASALFAPEAKVLLLNTTLWCADEVPPLVLPGFNRALSLD